MRNHQVATAAFARLLVVVSVVVSATVIAFAPPARADYSGPVNLPGDVTLTSVDTLFGVDLTAGGTVTIPPTTTVRVVNVAIIRAPHIRVDGRLFADGAATGLSGAGQDGLFDGVGCGGGGGGGSFGVGGDGGNGSVGRGVSGGAGGAAVLSGPGRNGGDGASCAATIGGRGGVGGGSIHLISPDIQIAGTVTANGTSGFSGSSPSGGGAASGGGGGGGGGEIVLTGNAVLSGALTARGGVGGFGGDSGATGVGGAGGGGGSGGRIRVEGTLTAEPGAVVDAGQNLRALGGLAGQGGTAGQGAPGALGSMSISTPTTTILTSSQNPSTAGQSVTFTATVTPSDAPGSVTFSADGSPIDDCVSVPVTSGGAACATAALGQGLHAITADFAPSDAVHGGSIGTLVGGQRVNAAPDLPQAITFPAQTDHVIGEPPFALTGISGGGSGNPVTVTASGACTVSGSTVTLTDVGTCSLTADQAGGNGYLDAASVSRSFAVSYGQRVLALSATGRRGGLVAIVLRLTDAGGANLSSAAVPVRATALDGGPIGAVLTPDPANNFPYSPLLGSYTFAEYLRTGLARGQHTLTFTAGADPRPHTITFTTI